MHKKLSVFFLFVFSFTVVTHSAWAFGVVGADGESGEKKQSGISGMKSGGFYKPMSSVSSSTSEAAATGDAATTESASRSGFYKPASVSNHGGLNTTKSVAKQRNLLSSDLSFGKTTLTRSSSTASE